MSVFDAFYKVDFPVDHDKISQQISESQIEAFVDAKLDHLFEKIGPNRIQNCITSATEIEPQVTSFFTHVIEIGTVKTLAFNDILDDLEDHLINYAYFIGWCYNICIGEGLIKRGMTDIPKIGGGRVPLYFSDDAIRRILERVSIHIDNSENNGVNSLDFYADSMINNHLVFR